MKLQQPSSHGLQSAASVSASSVVKKNTETNCSITEKWRLLWVKCNLIPTVTCCFVKMSILGYFASQKESYFWVWHQASSERRFADFSPTVTSKPIYTVVVTTKHYQIFCLPLLSCKLSKIIKLRCCSHGCSFEPLA